MRERSAARFQRSISAVFLAASLAGCTGWHQVPMASPMPHSDHPQSLRVTLADGRQWELRKAQIAGDSLVGQSGAWSTPVRTAFAVRDIRKFDDRRTNVGTTVGLILGVMAAVGVIGGVAAASALNFGN